VALKLATYVLKNRIRAVFLKKLTFLQKFGYSGYVIPLEAAIAYTGLSYLSIKYKMNKIMQADHIT